MHGGVEPGLAVEFAEWEQAEKLGPAWRDLLARALEPNAFLEPAFAIPAAQHLAQGRRPVLALAWECVEGAERLAGLWPLEARSAPLAPGLAQTWRHLHMTVGLPLLDAARAGEAADALIHAIAQEFGSRVAVLIPQVLRGGPTYDVLAARAQASGRAWTALSGHSRAVLRRGGMQPFEGASTKHRREAARQRRRLAERGSVAFRSAESGEDIREATEQFLFLEQKGWKGAKGTALLADPGAAAFTRSMVRLMNAEGKCRIDSLDLDGRPIAMGIVLRSRDRAYFWKTAFDQDFAAYSPGVQLTLDLSARQLAEDNIALTDSCAVADHPMIDRIWPERQEIVDLMIATRAEAPVAAENTFRAERLRRRAREMAKTAIQKARRRPGLAGLKSSPI